MAAGGQADVPAHGSAPSPTRIVLDVYTDEFDRSSGAHPWGTGECDGAQFRFDGWVGLANAIEHVLAERAPWQMERADQ
jgi:hypothetical protein